MNPIVPAWVVALLLLASGCRPSPPPSDPEALVRVGDAVVRVGQVRTEWQRRHARGESPEPWDVLDDLVHRQRLVQRARQLGLDQDPGVARAWENALIAKLKDHELGPRLRAASVSESDLQAATESMEHSARRFGDVRLAVVRQGFHSKTPAARKKQLRERLENLPVDAPPAQGFGRAAVDVSDDDASRYQGGDLGWQSENPAASSLDPAVFQAAGQLRQPGEISPIIEGTNAFYRIRLIERRAPLSASAKTALAVTQHRAWQQKRAELESEFQKSVADAVPIEIVRPLQPAEVMSPFSMAATAESVPPNP